VEDGKVVDWPYQAWMWTALQIHKRRQAKEDQVEKIKQDSAQKIKLGAKMAQLERDIQIETDPGKMREMREELASLQRERKRSLLPAVKREGEDEDEAEDEDEDGRAGNLGLPRAEPRKKQKTEQAATTSALADMAAAAREANTTTQDLVKAMLADKAEQRKHDAEQKAADRELTMKQFELLAELARGRNA